MNHAEQRLSEARRQHNEAVVTRHLHPLFQMLAGFSLRPDLKVAEVVFMTGYTAGRDLYGQVTESLVQFAEECPEAATVVRESSGANSFALVSGVIRSEARRVAFDSAGKRTPRARCRVSLRGREVRRPIQPSSARRCTRATR